jgi:hypothetical protein
VFGPAGAPPATTEEKHVTIATVETTDDSHDQAGEDPAPAEESDPPAPTPLPDMVWFGPRGLGSVERELTTFLGTHHGVAVLQWPRDTERAAHFTELGIPCLCLVGRPSGEPAVQQGAELAGGPEGAEPAPCGYVDVPPVRPGLEEWLPDTASRAQIDACIKRLGGCRS